MSIEKLITEHVLKMLRHQAEQRAQSLNKEARSYWHADRARFHELRARATEFKTMAAMFQQLREPYLPAFPALSAAVDVKAVHARRIIKKKKAEAPLEFKLYDNSERKS